MNKSGRLSVEPTQQQKKWLIKEKKKTSESFSTIIKRLIQDKIIKNSGKL